MELYKASIEKLIADKEAVTRINLEMQQKMRDVSLQGQRREDNQKKGGAVEQFVADELTDLVKQKHKLLEDAKVAIERANAYMGCTEKIFATGLMMNECLTKKQEELQMNAQKLESAAHQFVQKRAIRKKEVETEGIHLKRLAEETEQRLTRTADIEKLNAILLSLKQRMEHVAESVKAKEQRYDEMSTQQKQIEDETEQLQNLIKEKEELKRIILAKIESERKMATALMKKQEQLQRETNKSAQLLTERQQDLGEKKTLIEKTQAEVRELEAQLVGAKEKNTQAAAELNERKELNAKLNTELTQMRQDDVKAIRQKTAEHKEILEAAEEKLATLIKEAEKFAQECDPTKLEGYETFKDLNVETLNAMLEEALKKEEALQKEVDAKRAIQEQIIEEKRQVLEKKAVLAQENMVAHNKLDEELKTYMQELEERKEHLNGEEETRERKQHELRIAKDRVNAVKAMETSQKEQADRKLADINKQLSAARQEARLLQTGSWKLTDHNDKMAGGDDVALEKKRKIKTEISSTDRLLPRKEQLLSQFNQPKAQSQPMRDGMLNAKRRSSFNKNNARTQGLVDSEDGDEVRPIPVVLPPDVEWASQHGGQVYAAIVEDNSTPFDAFKNSRMTDAVPAELTKGSGMNNFTDTQASELTLAPETINVLTQMDENHDNSIVNETMETEYDSFEGTLDFSMNRNQMDIEGRFPADIFLHTDPTKATRDPTTTHDEASSTERTENPSEVDEASLRAIAPSRRPHESQSLDDTIATIQTQDTIDDPFDDDLF